jgi:hypothetical protein
MVGFGLIWYVSYTYMVYIFEQVSTKRVKIYNICGLSIAVEKFALGINELEPNIVVRKDRFGFLRARRKIINMK